MRNSLLSRQSMELLKELVEILREIISSGDEESLQRLQQMVRSMQKPASNPATAFIDLPRLLTAQPERVNGSPRRTTLAGGTTAIDCPASA